MKSLFETYLKLTGYDISCAGKELKQIQSLSPEEFQKWQDNKKWEIARYHFYNNAFYRKKISEHNYSQARKLYNINRVFHEMGEVYNWV